MQQFGIYYPHIQFADDTWTKVSALYWPRLARIIPRGVVVNDSETIRELRESLNFVIDVDPTPVIDQVSRVLAQVVRTHGAELRRRYAIPSFDGRFGEPHQNGGSGPLYRLASRRLEHRHQRDIIEVASRTPPRYTRTPDSALVGLHLDEMSQDLTRLLLDNGLAGNGNAGWVGMDPALAWVYLCMVAAELAERNRLIPVTDEPAGQLAIRKWDPDLMADALLGPPPAEPVREASPAIGLLALRLVVPANLHEIPTSKIIQIRKRYEADFDAFHNTLTALAEDLSSELQETTSPSVLQAYLQNEIRIRFERPLKDLDAALCGLGVNTAFAATNVKFELPAAVAATTGGLIAGSPLLAGTGAAAFALMALGRATRRDRTAILRPTAASYLLRVDREISPRNLVTRVREQLIPPARPRRY